MNKALLFAKRNLLEMVRDPLLYVFCLGFPVLMVVLFQVIIIYTDGSTPIFEIKGLIPGIMMFSFTFLMLMAALHISKDRTSSFLKRLFTSPLKSHHFIIGYFIPFFVLGISQAIFCIVLGYICGAINQTYFCSFGSALLLVLVMLPIIIIDIMIGMVFGTILNDKSAPAVSSIFISASGVLGGAWMPIDVMGSFETACVYLPFYPSVYLGRIITGATHTPQGEAEILNPILYTFDKQAVISLVVIGIYLVLALVLPIALFKKKMSSDRI